MYNDPLPPYNDLPPLPPLQNLETPRIWKACNEANKSLAFLKGSGDLIPNQKILINAIPLLEAKASSEIENIFTTSDSLYRALSATSGNIDSATKEVLRYREALSKGYTMLTAGRKLGEVMLTRICETLEGHEIQTRWGNEGTRIETENGVVVYTPPDDGAVISRLIHQLEDYMEEEPFPDPLIRLALIHYQFEAIHPFEDANGRTGRILNILYLVEKDLLKIPVLYLSRYIIIHKSEYYSLLRKVTEEDAWEDWIVFILTAIKETADWTNKRVREIHTLMEDTMRHIKEKYPRNAKLCSHELIEKIFLQPYCTIDFLVLSGLGSRQTISNYLKQLEKIQVLKSFKIGNKFIYVNIKLYNLLQKP